jgi:hypothetical protein
MASALRDEPVMARATAEVVSLTSHADSMRERRRRESFAPLSIAPANEAVAAVDEPAFHDIEEAFFRAGSDESLQRNEGDEYEEAPTGFFRRIFSRKAAV